MTNKLSDKKNNNKELWKIKRQSQSKQTRAFSIKDMKGNEINNPEGIKNRVTEYFTDLYKNNEIKEGYEEYHEDQENFIKQCWKAKDESKEKLNDSEIYKIMGDLEEGKAVGPDWFNNEMIIESGRSMKESIIRMMKIIYKTEELPNEWNKAYMKKYL